MQPILNVAGLMLIYGLFHSITAALGFKEWLQSLLGERLFLGIYRLFYSVISTLLLLPIMAYVAANPGNTVWRVDLPYTFILLIIQGLGALGLLISILQIDGMRFLGLRQFFAYLNGDPLPLPAEPLQKLGVYGLVRHPLYLFSMMALWSTPIMTEASFGFVLGISLYFIFGSLWEEHKLRQLFGETYSEYQKEVPWLIPFIKF